MERYQGGRWARMKENASLTAEERQTKRADDEIWLAF